MYKLLTIAAQSGFLLLPSRADVRFQNRLRGKAEQQIKDRKQAVKMARLSCHRFRGYEVRLWLSILACNLGNLWRRLVLAKGIEVVDQPAAAVGEDERTTGKASEVRLAAAAGRAPDEITVRGDIAQDREVAASGKPTHCNAANPNHGGQRRMERCRRN
jgi:Transposase DDE domain group 1